MVPSRRRVGELVLLSLAVAFLFQGTHGLFDSSEGRYAEVAREMLDSGNYLEPTLDHHPHWSKPPMSYWVAAAGMRLLGRNAWGARFFNALAFSLTALLVAAAGSRLWNARTGFIAGLVYLSSPLPVLGAAFLTADTVLTLWEVAAVVAFITSWRASSERKARWLNRAMWLFFGVAFFTKGPPALLPLFALIAFSVSCTKRPVMFDPLGLTLFFVSGGWWYAIVSVRNPGMLDYFVRQEIFARNFTNNFQRNPQWWAPFMIYLPTLLLALGPWLVGVVYGVHHALGRASSDRPKPWGPRGTPHRLLFLWFVLPLVVFFLSKSRQFLYLLPLHAPLALAAAAAMTPCTRKRLLAMLATLSLVWSLGFKASLPLFNRRHNAKLLHAAVVSLGGAATQYMMLGEGALYGVQFYFDGNVERVSIGEPQPWARRDLSAVVAGIGADASSWDPGARYVFITDAAGVREAEKAFAGSGALLSVERVYGHEIVVVRGGEPSRAR